VCYCDSPPKRRCLKLPTASGFEQTDLSRLIIRRRCEDWLLRAVPR